MASSPKEKIQRLKKAFYRKYIKKHHSFILCKHEKRSAMRLDKLLNSSRKIYFCEPHGIRRECRYQGFSRPMEEALNVIRGLIHLIDLVHRAGYSFNGRLCIKNLCWLAYSKTIKISGLLIEDMVKKTRSGIKSDFTSIHDMVKDYVFEGSKVPRELKYLMRYMRSNPVKYGNLIRHNICFLDDESKVGRFIALYQKLTIIRKLNSKIYCRALKKVKCGFCGPNAKYVWQSEVKSNNALFKVFDHHKSDYYSPDEGGVTLFGRHCCHHATDDSVKYENNTKVIKYSSADIFPMLECHIPGLFAQVQEAIFEVIEQHPQELQKLRNKVTGCV